MMDDAPITQLIGQMKSGDEDAARRIWELYKRRVAGLVRKRLPSPADPNDVSEVAADVLASVLVRAQQGKFEPTAEKAGLQNRDQLERILFRVAFCKAVKKGKQILASPISLPELEDTFAKMSDQEIETGIRDCVEKLEARLTEEDSVALKVFQLRMTSSLTQKEIAGECGVHISTVERKLKYIRSLLSEMLS